MHADVERAPEDSSEGLIRGLRALLVVDNRTSQYLERTGG